MPVKVKAMLVKAKALPVVMKSCGMKWKVSKSCQRGFFVWLIPLLGTRGHHWSFV